MTSRITNFPKRVIFADCVISLFLVSGLRISKRLYMEVFREKGMSKDGKRTLIIGAGNAGEMILRDMARQGYDLYWPVWLLDDDPMKVDAYLRNLKVLGKTAIAGSYHGGTHRGDHHRHPFPGP